MAEYEDIPPTMRAWSYSSRGEPASVLKFTSLFKTPSSAELGPDDVLVKVAYCTTKYGMSLLMPFERDFMVKRPTIPEAEFSGTVVALGSNVASARPDLRPGAQVFGIGSLQIRSKTGLGSLAEYFPCPAGRLACVPESMSLEDASAIAGAGATALQVFDLNKLKKGDKVLINGGSGGAGSALVQRAKSVVGETGNVVATCSAVNFDMVKALGADEVIDYREHAPLHEYLAKTHSRPRFDVIVDTIGIQNLYTNCPAYLTENGRFINIGAMGVSPTLTSLLYWAWQQFSNEFWPVFFGGTPRWYRFLSGKPDHATLERVKELVDQGQFKPVLDSVWNMEDALKAYERIASQRSKGKVIIRVQDA